MLQSNIAAGINCMELLQSFFSLINEVFYIYFLRTKMPFYEILMAILMVISPGSGTSNTQV